MFWGIFFFPQLNENRYNLLLDVAFFDYEEVLNALGEVC